MSGCENRMQEFSVEKKKPGNSKKNLILLKEIGIDFHNEQLYIIVVFRIEVADPKPLLSEDTKWKAAFDGFV